MESGVISLTAFNLIVSVNLTYKNFSLALNTGMLWEVQHGVSATWGITMLLWEEKVTQSSPGTGFELLSFAMGPELWLQFQE